MKIVHATSDGEHMNKCLESTCHPFRKSCRSHGPNSSLRVMHHNVQMNYRQRMPSDPLQVLALGTKGFEARSVSSLSSSSANGAFICPAAPLNWTHCRPLPLPVTITSASATTVYFSTFFHARPAMRDHITPFFIRRTRVEQLNVRKQQRGWASICTSSCPRVPGACLFLLNFF